MANILIAVPTTDGVVTTACMNSLFAICDMLRERGIAFTRITWDGANIVSARNHIASLTLVGDTFSHALFIDNDMDVKAETVGRMIDANVDVIGGVCTRRALPITFNVLIGHGDQISDDGRHPSRVTAIGAAVLLVSRGAFQRLSTTVRRTTKSQHKAIPAVFGFFDQITQHDDLLAEDFSFCHRWRESGGVVHALPNEDIGHVGSYVYRGNYLDHIRSMSPLSSPS